MKTLRRTDPKNYSKEDLVVEVTYMGVPSLTPFLVIVVIVVFVTSTFAISSRPPCFTHSDLSISAPLLSN